MSAQPPVLEVEGLVKHFPVRGFGAKGVVHAVDDVSFTIGRGELVGLVVFEFGPAVDDQAFGAEAHQEDECEAEEEELVVVHELQFDRDEVEQ